VQVPHEGRSADYISQHTAYLTSPAATPWRAATVASASSCRQQQYKRLETLEEAFEAKDNISQLTPAGIKPKEKLTAEPAVPGGFHYLLLDGTLVICRMRLVESEPEEQAAITVRGDLTVVITLDGRDGFSLPTSAARRLTADDVSAAQRHDTSQLLAVVWNKLLYIHAPSAGK